MSNQFRKTRSSPEENRISRWPTKLDIITTFLKLTLKGSLSKEAKENESTQVTDLSVQRTYTTNVRNICGERDFMRIEAEAHAPDAIEKMMANFEANCIGAIRRVAESGKFDGEDANLTLNLMALLAVRSPEMRENIRDSVSGLPSMSWTSLWQPKIGGRVTLHRCAKMECPSKMSHMKK